MFSGRGGSWSGCLFGRGKGESECGDREDDWLGVFECGGWGCGVVLDLVRWKGWSEGLEGSRGLSLMAVGMDHWIWVKWSGCTLRDDVR